MDGLRFVVNFPSSVPWRLSGLPRQLSPVSTPSASNGMPRPPRRSYFTFDTETKQPSVPCRFHPKRFTAFGGVTPGVLAGYWRCCGASRQHAPGCRCSLLNRVTLSFSTIIITVPAVNNSRMRNVYGYVFAGVSWCLRGQQGLLIRTRLSAAHRPWLRCAACSRTTCRTNTS